MLRAKLTPTFTSGRMKFMFQTIVDVADNFQKCLAGMVEGNENFELRDVLSRFTTDVIGEYFYAFFFISRSGVENFLLTYQAPVHSA